MLAELFKLIKECGKKEASVAAEHIAAEPKHVYHYRNSKGMVTEVEAEPFPRNHNVGSFDSFVKACRMKMYERRGKADVEYTTPRSVWYSRKGCCCLLDDRKRRDSVSWNLSPSQEMSSLSLVSIKPMSQTEFVRFLRVEMASSRDTVASVLTAFKKWNAKTISQSTSIIGQGKSNIGRKAESAVYGDAEFPEEIILFVPVFDQTPKYTTSVKCDIDIDPVTEKIKLTPYPGQLAMAVLQAEMDLGSDLMAALNVSENDQIPIYLGNPNLGLVD